MITFTDDGRTLTKPPENLAGHFVVPTGVRKIGEVAFFGRKDLTSLLLSSEVEEIDAYAFFGCSALIGVVIPNNVRRLGAYAFAKCDRLSHVIIPANCEIQDNTFSETTRITCRFEPLHHRHPHV